MKLKIYRTFLLAFLFSLAGLNVFFFAKTIMGYSSYESTSDFIIFMLVLLVMLAFIVLEIGNTFVSFKNGSTFIKALVYDKDEVLNKRGLIIYGTLALISLGVTIYLLLLILGNDNLYFAFIAKPMQYLAFLFFSTMLVDMCFVLIYPLLKIKD